MDSTPAPRPQRRFILAQHSAQAHQAIRAARLSRDDFTFVSDLDQLRGLERGTPVVRVGSALVPAAEQQLRALEDSGKLSLTYGL